jgi:integrase
VRWLKKGEPMPAWIFPSPKGTALEERNVRTVFVRLLAKADMRQICIHDLRHTYSPLLLQTGAPITYVSQQPGHRDASITLRVYAHWLPMCRAASIGSTRYNRTQPPRNRRRFRRRIDRA